MSLIYITSDGVINKTNGLYDTLLLEKNLFNYEKIYPILPLG
jgi:hypothetical protein